MKCKYENKKGTCGLKGSYAYKHKCYTEDLCKCFEPITNADRIRAMSDEELAKFLLKWIACDKDCHLCVPVEYKQSGKCNGKCVENRVVWLKSEAKEASE